MRQMHKCLKSNSKSVLLLATECSKAIQARQHLIKCTYRLTTLSVCRTYVNVNFQHAALEVIVDSEFVLSGR